MAMDWFRSWHGAPTDTAFLVIARRAQVAPGMVSAVYWALLDYASQNNSRGSIAGFDTEAYAEWAGWEESQVIAIIAAFQTKGKITEGGEIVAWADRQPKREDDSRQRVAEHRERERELRRQQEALQANVTHGNAVKQNVTIDQIRSESDQKRDERSAPPPPAPTVDTDPEFKNAVAKFDSSFGIGSLSGQALLDFSALWPDLGNGRRAWVDDAIAVAKAYNARTPAYAVNVLAGAVKDGKRPGQRTETPRNQGRNQERDLAALVGLK